MALSLAALAVVACQPKVQIEAHKEPFEINIKVKIQQEVRIKVEKDVDDLFADNENLF